MKGRDIHAEVLGDAAEQAVRIVDASVVVARKSHALESDKGLLSSRFEELLELGLGDGYVFVAEIHVHELVDEFDLHIGGATHVDLVFVPNLPSFDTN